MLAVTAVPGLVVAECMVGILDVAVDEAIGSVSGTTVGSVLADSRTAFLLFFRFYFNPMMLFFCTGSLKDICLGLISRVSRVIQVSVRFHRKG